MNVQMSINTKEVIEYLQEVGYGRQTEYVISKGLNTLANKIQATIRQRIEQKFKLRRRQWILNRVYISKEDRATKTNWSVTIQIKEDNNILSKFEEGGDKVAINGKKYLAIPNDRVFKGKIIRGTDPLRIQNLQLKNVGSNMEGDLGTYLTHDKDTGTPIIAQRIEKGMKGRGISKRGLNKHFGSRILYTLVKKSKIPARLEFVKTAQEVADKETNAIFNDVLQQAIQSAKRRG